MRNRRMVCFLKVFAVGILIVMGGCLSVKEARLGDQMAQEGNWEGAIASYQAALEKDPTDRTLREKLDEVKAKAAEIHMMNGKELLKEQNIDLAVQEFKKALSLDPSKKEHRSALAGALRKQEADDHFKVGQRFANVSKFEDALAEFERALELDPSHVQAQQALIQVTEELEEQLAESGLALKSTQPITLKFQNARLKEVFELLSKTSGINILFDKDVRDDNVTIFVRDVSFNEALNLILATNNLFMKKINEETILIIPKIKQKVDQYQDLIIRTFYLSNVKAKDMVNLLRTMLETRRVFVNEDLNALVLRDTPEKIKLAEKIINANDRKIAEVVFDVEILEVLSSNKEKFGWRFSDPQSTISVRPGSEAGSATLEQLGNIGQGAILFSLPSIIVDFLKTESDAKTLANPKIRILNNESAKVNIGDKVPILLSETRISTGATTTGEITGTAGTSLATNIEFKDVGIQLNVTEAKIHLNNDVTVKIGLDVTTLGPKVDLGPQLSQQFGNRSVETVLNIKDGETVVIGGLIREEEKDSVNKVPLFGDIPILGYFFSGFDKDKTQTDIFLTITPQVVRSLETPDKAIQSFWSGTGEAYSTKPLFSDFAPFGGLQESDGLPPLPEPPRQTPSQKPRTPPSPPGQAPSPNSPGFPFTPPSVPSPPGQSPSSPSRPSPTGELPQLSSEFMAKPVDIQLPVVSLKPSQGELTLQQEMGMAVVVNQISRLSEALFILSYDPEVLTLKRAEEGSFLRQGGVRTSFVTSDDGKGRLSIHVKRLGDMKGISGSGDLVQLTFSGAGVGTSPIFLEKPQLLTPARGFLPAQSLQAQIRVQ